ncbi:MAG TPA: NYN domain-containing protein [Anaerolineales bacterium]|nr:NYN domain-containing protein [Anaerolineales bacterium]
MPYIVDGHNLIGRLPDIHLSEIDDEDRLIERVAAFCRVERKRAEIFFDRAAPGRSGRFRQGPVTSVFVPSGETADAAIARRLDQLKKDARNWTVVSSDAAVQASARNAGAQVLPSENFAGRLNTPGSASGPEKESNLAEGELEEWLRLFGEEDG